jgi:membrane protein
MTIEQTFNDIWGVQQGRSIWRQVVYYWTWITLGPLMILCAVAFTSTAEFSHWSDKFAFLQGSERFLIALAPFVILWVGFGLLYGLMPNTRVRFHAALVGGIVGGTLWQLNSILNTMYMSRVVTFSKIYGALGILPVFLLGVYFSWLIVLFGAQVSFAVQNVHAFIQKRASERLDQAGRELLASSCWLCNGASAANRRTAVRNWPTNSARHSNCSTVSPRGSWTAACCWRWRIPKTHSRRRARPNPSL